MTLPCLISRINYGKIIIASKGGIKERLSLFWDSLSFKNVI